MDRIVLVLASIFMVNKGLNLGFSEPSPSKVYNPANGPSYIVAYDPVLERYIFIGANYLDESNKIGLEKIDANYAANASMSDPEYEGPRFLTSTVIPANSVGVPPFYYGSDIANNKLYLADTYGRLSASDLDTENVINYINFVDTAGYDSNYNNGAALVNAVCIDPDDTTKAYVPTTGGDIYEVDISSNTVGGWTKTKILSNGDAILDQDGANSRDEFIARDCTVDNGIVYFVETAGTGNLLIYDILQDAFSYNSIISTPAQSITSIMGALVISAPGDQANPTSIFATDIPLNGEAFAPPQEIATINLIYITQITTDSINDIVAVIGFGPGYEPTLRFLESYVTTANPTDMPTRMPTTEPTVEPTVEPTTMDPTTAMPTTAMPTTATPTMPTPSPVPTTPHPVADDNTETDAGNNNFDNAALIVMSCIIGNILLFV